MVDKQSRTVWGSTDSRERRREYINNVGETPPIAGARGWALRQASGVREVKRSGVYLDRGFDFVRTITKKSANVGLTRRGHLGGVGKGLG